ncbi:amino acid adenylation domain-containing protein [Nocardia gipuzkoensis]|uniref:amino acid adenylation domain-containing protein n=1 Tax=Nocardia gipuzkoensis TaxID=2749991 RepID=UPI003EDE86F3
MTHADSVGSGLIGAKSTPGGSANPRRPYGIDDLPAQITTVAELQPWRVALRHDEVVVTYAALAAELAALSEAMGPELGPDDLLPVVVSRALPALMESGEGALGAVLDALVDDARTAARQALSATAPVETLLSRFQEQVRRTPDAIALEYPGPPPAHPLPDHQPSTSRSATLTYGEFGSRVTALARHLVALGVGPETLVGLAIRHSFDLLVGMYAIIEAGGAYLPIDPGEPADRIAAVLRVAEPAVVLTTTWDEPEFGADVPTLRIDRLEDLPAPSAPVVARSADDIAYVMVSSESTGRPEGVAVSHRSIVANLYWRQRMFRLRADDVVLQQTPCTTDGSVWEFFWPLSVGARLVMAAPDRQRDPAYLAGVIRESGVTVTHFAPSVLAMFLADRHAAALDSLRMVFASGEELPAATAAAFRDFSGATLYHLHGPTETAIDVTAHEVTAADVAQVPIGAAADDTELLVLDENLRPVARGAVGELYLSGVQLARGYVTSPGLTAERFVANPEGPPGERMYRTGERVRWSHDGELLYPGEAAAVTSADSTHIAGTGEPVGGRIPAHPLFDATTADRVAIADEQLAADSPALFRRGPEPIALSPAQWRLWFLNRIESQDGADSVHNLPIVLRLTGRLDVKALERAVLDVLARHETLRTVYAETDSGPDPSVLDAADIGLSLHAVPISRSAVDDAVAGIVRAGFDLTTELPARVALLAVDRGDASRGVIGDEYVLVFVAHHIAADAESVAPLVTDLIKAYLARLTSRRPQWDALPMRYADYRRWHAELLGAENVPGDLAYQQLRFWRDALDGAPAQLPLPTDRPRPAVASQRGAAMDFTIPPEVTAGLRALARRGGATLFMTLHAAFAATLARLSGSADIVIGSPVAGRGDPALDALVGLFDNTLALRTRVDPDASFTALLADVREGDSAAFANADLPFARLVDAMRVDRLSGAHPLFQVMFSFEAASPAIVGRALEVPWLSVRPVEMAGTGGEFDLHLVVGEKAGSAGLSGSLRYATDLFDAATAESYVARFRRLLVAVAVDPDVRIGDIELLSDAESARILHEWNATAHAIGEFDTLASLFADQTARTPDAPAITFDRTTLSYAEFGGVVNRLARYLIAAGVGPESLVALWIRHPFDLVVGIYAVIEAGGGYIALDPGQSAEHILAMATPVLVLTDGSGLNRGVAEIRIDRLDLSGYPGGPLTDADRRAPLRPANTAYVSFPSGYPGVVMSHGAIVNRLRWMQSAYAALGPGDVLLQKAPGTDDVSVPEFFWPLQAGARMVLARPGGHRDPAYLARLIRSEGVTVAHFVPSMLAAFVAQAVDVPSLREVFCSGEALPGAVAQRMRALTGAALHNGYGATEAAVQVTFHEVSDADFETVPIGRPIWNTRAYVLDARLRPVPVGVPGELYLAGAQLARGYLGRAGHTGERFVADPFGPAGERMYRTGDLAVWTAAGELEFLGRTDVQTQIRGLRLDLGEIESALLAVPGIGQAAVLVRDDRGAGEQLVAYLVATGTVETATVREQVAERLPGYLVPEAFVVLDRFPVDASGKLDRTALPAPAFEPPMFQAPSGLVETLVAQAFTAVLEVTEVGVDDDLFALGGDSFSAIQLAARLSEATGAEVAVRTIFDAPTVRALARRITVNRPIEVAHVARPSEGKPVALSPVATGAVASPSEVDPVASAPVETGSVRSLRGKSGPVASEPAALALSSGGSSPVASAPIGGEGVTLPGERVPVASAPVGTGSVGSLRGKSGPVASSSEPEAVALPSVASSPAASVPTGGGGAASAPREVEPVAFSPIGPSVAEQAASPPVETRSVGSRPVATGRVTVPSEADPVTWAPGENTPVVSVPTRGKGGLLSGEVEPVASALVETGSVGSAPGGTGFVVSPLVGSGRVASPSDAEPDALSPAGSAPVVSMPTGGRGVALPSEGEPVALSSGGTGTVVSPPVGSGPLPVGTAPAVSLPTGSGRVASPSSEAEGAALSSVGAGPDALRSTEAGPVVSPPSESNAAVLPPLTPQERGGPTPLSIAQQRLWFLNRFDTASGGYNIPFALRLTGALNVSALEAAVADVIARHETLRTLYPEHDGVATQVVLPAGTKLVELVARPVPAAQVSELVGAATRAGFDVTAEVPLRVRLWRVEDEAPTGAQVHVLLFVVHHIVADGWSFAPLTRDLANAYVARCASIAPAWGPLPVQYADFAIWQRAALGSADDPASVLSGQLAYWTDRLAGLPEVVTFPSDRPRPAVATNQGGVLTGRLDAALHQQIRDFAAAHDLTPFMVLHAALAVLSSRYGAGADVVIGTPVDGRGADALADLVGTFVNTLVLRTEVRQDASLAELLASVRATDLAAFGHAAVPFAQVVEAVKPVRSQAHTPLYQVALTLRNKLTPEFRLHRLAIAAYPVGPAPIHLDLDWTLTDRYTAGGAPDGIDVHLRYALDLFDAPTVAGFLAAFERVLRAMVRDVRVLVGNVELMSLAERGMLLSDRNATTQALPAETLDDLLTARVAATPDEIGLRFENSAITYAEFASRVNRLARALIGLGVGPEIIVGLAASRSIDMLVAMYAIVRAGGAYLPIDPAHPAERLAQVVASAAPRLLLTVGGAALPGLDGVPVIDLADLDLSGLAEGPVSDADRIAVLRPDNTAYVLFEGAAMLPKGVAVTHRAILNQLRWFEFRYRVTASDRILQHAPLTSEVSVWECFLPIAVGAPLVIARPSAHLDLGYVAGLLREHGITIAEYAPSMLAALIGQGMGDALRSLRHLRCGGAALTPALLLALRGSASGLLHNAYGAPETAISAICHEFSDADIESGRRPVIGRPCWNTRAYVLDARLRPVPIGVTGELYLAGGQLARGYHARPGLTAQRFVADPFGVPGRLMYRTGDLVRWNRDGALEYLGRSDFRMVRGRRIGLGEIEAALAAATGVTNAAVLPSEDNEGSTCLVGYVTGTDRTPQALLAEVRAHLPAAQVPAHLVVLDEMPLTAEGKLDRSALPAVDCVGTVVAVRGPGDRTDVAPVEMPLTTVGTLDRPGVPMGCAGTVRAVRASQEGPAAESGEMSPPAADQLYRSALPAVECGATAARFRPPREGAEAVLATLVAELVGVARIGADDDFFASGGNSLLAVRLVARANATLGCALTVREVFQAPTVAQLARRVTPSAEPGTALSRCERPARIPLSPGQFRMWLLHRLDPDSGVHNIPIAIRLTGVIDYQALRAALRDVVVRHETLRTVFPADADGPTQVVLPGHDVPEPALDPITVTAPHLCDAVLAAIADGFDLLNQVPLRASLLRIDQDDHVLVVVIHHIAADAASAAPLVRDLMTAYTARLSGETPRWRPLPVQYADFTLWQLGALGAADDPSSTLSNESAYWREELAGLGPVLELPADRPRPPVASGRGAGIEIAVPVELTGSITDLARRHSVSMFMVLHAAFATLLARLAGVDDVAIGTTVAGRSDKALDDLVGMFDNTVVLRTPVATDASFAELLARVREIGVRAFAHADLPFARLVEELKPVRSSSHSPVVQAMLTFRHRDDAALRLPGLTVSAYPFQKPVTQFDLAMELAEHQENAGTTLRGVLRYATDLFDRATAAAFAARFTRVLRTVVSDESVRVGDLDLLDAAERLLVLDRWNDTAAPVDPAATLVSLFEAQVVRTPDAPAVTVEGPPTHPSPDHHPSMSRYATLTYAEFAARARRLARWLVGAGVGPDAPVALGMRSSLDLVVGIYAVTLAGGAYVPLDPARSTEQLECVLRTVRPVCVLTSGLDLDAGEARQVRLDRLDLRGYSAEPLTELDRLGAPRPAHTAHVIFTSESTGRPEGTAVSHAAIVNRLTGMQSAYPLSADDVVLLESPATAAASVWELFWPLAFGAKLVVARPDGHRDAAYPARVIAEQRVTTAHFAPPMLGAFLADPRAADCTTLRNVFTSGEALPALVAQRAREVIGARVHNLYGPAGAAGGATCHEVTEDDVVSVPIGAPVFNTRVYVLDSRLHPVPVGVVGELYLAGAQLARGYVARPDLTADRFVADPFGAPGERMYRTGDLVTWTASGELNRLGCATFRGLRIQLDRIESALVALDSIAQAAVLVHSDEQVGDQLVAYVIPRAPRRLDTEDVRAALSAELPAHLVPASFVVLDRLPVGSSGELDHSALPAPMPAAYRAPATRAEATVARIMARSLGVERIGAHDDFFALGGDSLLAIQLAERLGAELNVELPARLLFEAPTVAALAARTQRLVGGGKPALVRRPRPARVPLSPAQQRMWFHNRFAPPGAGRNLAVVVRLTGYLDSDTLAAAVGDVVGRHETLRTVYPDLDGTSYQHILDPAPVREIHSLDTTDALREFVAGPFELTAEAPLRVGLITRSDRDHVLALVAHHIAADSFSMGVLVRDLATAYAARATRTAPDWPELDVQYADYAVWQRQVLGAAHDPDSMAARQLRYWRETLRGLPVQLGLHTDRPRPAVASHAAASTTLALPDDVRDAIAAVAPHYEATPFMVMHAALATLLARLAGMTDIAIGAAIPGRDDAALDDLVGPFGNVLVLRAEVSASDTFAAILRRVRDHDLDAFAHADVPFERVVEALDPPRSQARDPLFQVALLFQDLAPATADMAGVTLSEYEFGYATTSFDLQLAVLGGALRFTYATDLFDAPTVEAFGARLIRLLVAVSAAPDQVVEDIDLSGAGEPRPSERKDSAYTAS